LYPSAPPPPYDDVRQIDENDLIVKGNLARGTFGKVVKAKWGATAVVVKYMFRSSDANREIENLKKVARCDHVVDFHGVTTDILRGCMGIVMTYQPNGNLNNYLATHFSRLDWKDKFNLAEGIALGLDSIHSKGLLHRDLHPGNILIDEHGGVLLADFGLSCDEKSETSNKERTGRYLPPESLQKPPLPFTRKGDIYSLGVLYWVISSGRSPFSGMKKPEAVQAILNGKRENPIPDTPRLYQDLYVRCWAADSKDRPDMAHITKTLRDLLPSRYTGWRPLGRSIAFPILTIPA
jgi:serine/threonine protein kinase